MPLKDMQLRELLFARQRAEVSVARVKDAMEKEFEFALSKGIEPAPVQPLTEVKADLVRAAMEGIKGEVSGEVADIIAVYRTSLVRSAGRKVSLQSDQLIAVLDAAEITGGSAVQNEKV